MIVGKTNLHELAFGITGINPWFGTPVNPLDPHRVPGGSSSGSAVAVSVQAQPPAGGDPPGSGRPGGEADIAFGSDTGGSIRIPAACCGIVGLKTTRGRISLDGVRALAPSLDTIGPMAATVAGVADGMRLLEPAFSVSPSDGATRIGRFRLPARDWIDRDIDAALAAWATVTGGTVMEVELPRWEAATSAAMTILSAECWQTHEKLWRAHGDELSPDVSRRLELASLIDRSEVAEAWELARDWVAILQRTIEGAGLIALPSLAEEPPLLEEASRMAEIRYTAPFNLSGTPALSMPLAGRRRYPASLQLAGPAGGEETILATAGAIEAALGQR